MAGYPVNNSVQEEEISSRYLTLDKLVHISNAQRTSFVDFTVWRLKCWFVQEVAPANTKLAVGMAADQGQKHQMTDKLK